MSEISQHQTTSRIGALQIGIIILTLATACIHLYRGLLLGAPGLRPFPLLFYLNCLGYLALLAGLYFIPHFARFHRAMRWTLICYAALTIILWFLITQARPNILAYIDKPVELALIVLLLIEDQWARLRRS